MKKMVLLLAVALILPGIAAAQRYDYAGREGKMMATGEWLWKKVEQKKKQKKEQKKAEQKAEQKPTQAPKMVSKEYFYVGREGKMMATGDLIGQMFSNEGTPQKKATVSTSSTRKDVPQNYYYVGREGKMMAAGDLLWKALKKQSDKAAAKAAAQEEKNTESKK